METGSQVTSDPASIAVVTTIFGLTYFGLAIGEIPGLRIDRAGIALVGAAAMLACGGVSMHDAARAVDYQTIVLLFGMMVVVSYLRMAGFFAPGDRTDRRAFLPAADPSGGDDRYFRGALRVSGQ